MESEGHEEKYRAVIKGKLVMNRSAKGGARSSLRFDDEGVLIHPPQQGDCGRHGTEEQYVTSGELAESPGGTGAEAREHTKFQQGMAEKANLVAK